MNKNSLKITSFYLIFGILLVLYLNATIKLGIEEISLALVFLILTGIIFYFLLNIGIKKETKPVELTYRINDILEKSSFMVTILDENGNINYVNSRYSKNTGFKPEEIIGKNIKDIISDDPGKFEKIWETLNEGMHWSGELNILRTDNSTFTEYASFVFSDNTETSSQDFIKISIDVSSFKEEIKKLTGDLERIEILNNAKTQFLSSMSQEIRTPMSGIIGMTELMMLTNLTKEQKEYLDIINFSSSTLLAIINDILDFSRIESGRLKLEKIGFNVKDLIQKTVQIMDFDARRKKLSMKVNISDPIKYNILGDPLRVNQIIINLLKNSVKFTEKGSINLSVNETSRDGNIVLLKFTVSDTGSGITPEKIESLFGKLKNNEVEILTNDFVYKGTGLGIALVKHLTGMMGGKLFIESEEGIGTNLSVEIPFELAVKSEPVPEIETEGKKGLNKSDENKINILVAEDNVVNQRLVKELLVRKNYNVTIVENGLKIFDVLEQTDFDIILMDIQMPIMDGLEATSIIREIEKGTGKHTPIIGITAYAVKADKTKCMEAGMDDYLAKPFVKEEFYLMVEKYVRK
jgi:PAS domain S-box-containing protein